MFMQKQTTFGKAMQNTKEAYTLIMHIDYSVLDQLEG